MDRRRSSSTESIRLKLCPILYTTFSCIVPGAPSGEMETKPEDRPLPLSTDTFDQSCAVAEPTNGENVNDNDNDDDNDDGNDNDNDNNVLYNYGFSFACRKIFIIFSSVNQVRLFKKTYYLNSHLF